MSSVTPIGKCSAILSNMRRNAQFSPEDIAACRPNNNSAAAIRKCIETALRIGPVSTLFFNEVIGICAPAPRIFELRHDTGSNIQSIRISGEDSTGITHKDMALYYQAPGKRQGVKNA